MSAPPLPAVPPAWSWRELGGVLTDIEAGRSFKCDERPPREGEVGVVKVSAVTWGAFDESESKTCTDLKRVEPKFFIRPGDLLLSRANTINLVGNAVIARHVAGRVMLSDKILRLRLSDEVDPRWVLYALRSPHGRGEVERLATGNQESMRNIGQDRIRQIRIPCPPRPDQERIVAEIEEQFTRLDAGVEALKRLQAHLRRYRAAVLKAACEGRLDMSASLDVPRAKERNSASLPALPDSWRWAPFGSVLTGIQSGKNFRCEERPPNSGEYGVVKVSAVTWGTFDSDESKTCLDDSRFDEDILIRPGDFLFSRANTIQLVGTCVIAGAVTRRLMLSDKILRFTITGADPRWAMWMLRSPWGRAEIERLASCNQESMRNIGQDRIRQIRIPLPPMDEQSRLVGAIERHLSVADTATEVVEVALKRSARLRASILSRAFAGTLVSRDSPPAPSKASA